MKKFLSFLMIGILMVSLLAIPTVLHSETCGELYIQSLKWCDGTYGPDNFDCYNAALLYYYLCIHLPI